MGTAKMSNPDMEKIRRKVISEYKKGKKPKELSEKYSLSSNTVKSWIQREREKGNIPKQGEPAPKKKVGAPFGNTNAVGHGGTGPPGNQNALKHGGYSKIFWDTLSEEEQEMIDTMENSVEQQLLDEIALLTVRERRILKQIEKYRNVKSGQVISGTLRSEENRTFKNEEEKLEYENRIQAKVDNGDRLPGKSYRMTTSTEATYDVLNRLEEALSRCQDQKRRCLEALHRIRITGGSDPDKPKENNLVDALLGYTKEAFDTSDISELQQETESDDDMVE